MLKEKFDGAHEVKQKRKNGRRMLVTKFSRFKNHKDTDLVYLVTSPDYCEYDRRQERKSRNIWERMRPG